MKSHANVPQLARRTNGTDSFNFIGGLVDEHRFRKPPSGGFPEGLLDRAFTPGYARDPISKPVSTGLS